MSKTFRLHKSQYPSLFKFYFQICLEILSIMQMPMLYPEYLAQTV